MMAQQPWPQFRVGQTVEARWAGRASHYEGAIAADNGNGTWAVQYDDGDLESAVRTELVSALAVVEQFAVGDRVEARWQGKDAYYVGTIVADNSDASYEVQYDDGDHEKAAVYIRTRRCTWPREHLYDPRRERLVQCVAHCRPDLSQCHGVRGKQDGKSPTTNHWPSTGRPGPAQLARFDPTETTLETMRHLSDRITSKVAAQGKGTLSPW